MVGERGRLLIVDDNRTVAETIALIFTREGYEVRTACSAEQALALVREWQPSAAILDVYLPKMDGVALARLMRLACPGCRVTLISGQDLTADLFASLPAELALVAKPIDPDELLALVSDSLLPDEPLGQRPKFVPFDRLRSPADTAIAADRSASLDDKNR